MSDDRPTVAVFRPDDERLASAVTALEDAGVEPVADPMLAVEPTGATPERDADVVIFTSKTGVELVAEAGWAPAVSGSAGASRGESVGASDGELAGSSGGESAGSSHAEPDDESPTVAAIGAATAAALREAGYPVDVVPEEYTSAGLVEALIPRIERGETEIEVARSDHGSDVLLDGLVTAGADVYETVLYELRRPSEAGRSTELAAAGGLDGVCFTSSLTVEHFLAAAADRGVEDAARAGLEDAVVGVIGEPTAETAREHGLSVDVIPSVADVDVLIADVVDAVDRRRE